MTDLEIEVKFYIPDLTLIISRLQNAGAVSRGKSFETNLRFENPNRSLSARQALLRLRRDSRNRLTFKCAPAVSTHEDADQFKILRELEVEVSSFEMMRRILESLGYHVEQVYEKWRETFHLNETEICADTLPFGGFLEIEGEKEAIRSMAGQLGLKWENRILQNYLAIFDHLRRQTGMGFHDITFDNFKARREDFSHHIRHFEIGS